MPAVCLDCAADVAAVADEAAVADRCPCCAARRLVGHPELTDLAIAHIDCDAFYAAVEKRDNPALRARPVIVGGGARGVVAAACYIARLSGVHSAMPMFRARQLCPDAAVIKPDMRKYVAVGRQIRDILRSATPAVEPLSVDEAFLDLSGTDRLHGGSPAHVLVRLVQRIEAEAGVTASVGLSYNKFLAKFASDADKPRGFTVIGRAEAVQRLAGAPVNRLQGVGPAMLRRLHKAGLFRIGDLLAHDEKSLGHRFGSMGPQLYRLARGQDHRQVRPGGAAKSVSSETTFASDMAAPDRLARCLWPLCERVTDRMKQQHLAGRTVTLKLKTADFRLLTRSRALPAPTRLAETLYRAALPILDGLADGRRFRLIGIGLSGLVPDRDADPPDLADPDAARRKRVEQAIDSVRRRLGHDAIRKGRAL